MPAGACGRPRSVCSAVAARLTDTRNLLPARPGADSGQSGGPNRGVLVVLGVITAAAAIACTGAGAATSATWPAIAANASVQTGPAVTASTVAVIVSASASPVPDAATSSPAPSATPSPTPSAAPSGTPTATPSPTPSATPSPTPSATPSPTPSATPSPTKGAAPPRPNPSSPAPGTTPWVPAVQAEVPAMAQASSSRHPSAAASAGSTSQLADPPGRHLAGTLHATAQAGPSPTALAAALAALVALAGSSFVLARRQLAHPRRVPKHSHRRTRRGSYWSGRK